MKQNHIDTGRTAEDIAFIFLSNKGLKLLERNYRCSMGEIDIIMKDEDVLVFIEVRSRTNNRFIDPSETIDEKKKIHIINSSEHYLQKHGLTYSSVCRFDVVLFNAKPDLESIVWMKGAFEA